MIDPRPYTYEYRTPRLSNPTYRSSNMYDSLYHLRFPSKNDFVDQRPSNRANQQQFRLPAKADRNPAGNYQNGDRYDFRTVQMTNQAPQITRQHSTDLRDRYQTQKTSRNMSTNKQTLERADLRQSSSLHSNGVQSHLSNYGENLMKSSPFNRFEVYQKQQKGFNIINCQPKELANSLSVYPKLTLEDKLIQRGRYGGN